MKKKFTLQEWREIGDKAKEIKKNLNELLPLLKKLPKTQYLNKWRSADKAFGNLRSHLDEIVCGKFTDIPDRDITNIFYGLDERK